MRLRVHASIVIASDRSAMLIPARLARRSACASASCSLVGHRVERRAQEVHVAEQRGALEGLGGDVGERGGIVPGR
jgi:hypothetical protein